MNYNIPRKIRELQLDLLNTAFEYDYNIPRKIRELQRICSADGIRKIITYQEKLGNYNYFVRGLVSTRIITYQEKLGNYNFTLTNINSG